MKMKNAVVKTSLLSVAVLMCLSTQAMALPVAGDKVVMANGEYGTTNGGEFKVDVMGNSVGTDYISFCLERNESISYGPEYYINSVADYAESKGGVQDALDQKTKWVYWQYMTGGLGTTKSDELANKVQYVIWGLEGEPTDNVGWNDILTGWIGTRSDFSTPGYTVKVMNLVTKDSCGKITAYNQSQLIGEPVPEPTTMLLFGAGLAGLAAVGRRRRNN